MDEALELYERLLEYQEEAKKHNYAENVRKFDVTHILDEYLMKSYKQGYEDGAENI